MGIYAVKFWSNKYRLHFLPHHTRSLWVALASCSPQNKFQDYYYITVKVLQFQQPSYLAALIPRYVPTRSLRSSSSLSLCVPTRKTEMAKSKHFHLLPRVFGISSQGIFHPFPTPSCFQERLKHHLFLSAFPGNHSPSTSITFCDVSPSTDATQVETHPPPG